MERPQYQKMFELEYSHWWFLAKREFIRSYLPQPPQKWLILDLGAGTGGTSSFLQNWGKVTAVECCQEAISFLEKRKITYTSGLIEECVFPKGPYDLVTIFDVLYHRNIKSDKKVLEIAYHLLQQGGTLLITDCALPFLYGIHDTIMHARERYYLGNLTQDVEDAGFTIERKSYTYFFLFPLFVIFRLINKYVDFSTVGQINPVINHLFFYICKFEALLLQKISFPFGSSVIIKARKV